MNYYFTARLSLLTLALPLLSLAQNPSIPLFRTEEKITAEGELKEPIWKNAPEATGFIQIEPHEGEKANARTMYKIVANSTGIYIAVTMYIPNPKLLRTTSLTRDFTYINNDFVAIVIDGFQDKRNAMVFGCNPAGAQFDELSFDDQLYDLNWNGLWRVGTKIYPDRWVAEFELPWKTLRFKPGDKDQSWGLNVFRLNRATNESSAWSPYPRINSFTRMDYEGKLDSVHPPALHSNIQVTPYALFNQTNVKSGNPYQHQLEYGGDLKWTIAPTTVLDLTYHPDFAQAEADLQVNNTTRYSVFYPEKRQFFLENASFFGTGLNLATSSYGGHMQMQAFNSRSIGLDTNGVPVTIQGAARLVHRSLSDNYGFILAHQGDNDLNTSWLGTFRYSYNIGSGSRVGLLTNIDDHLLPGGDQLNLVNGADAFVRIASTESISTMLLHSYDSHNNHSGYAGYVQYYHTTDLIIAWLTGSYVGRGYENKLGFTSQTNVFNIAPGFSTSIRKINWLPFHDKLLDFEPGMIDEFDYNSGNKQLTHSEILLYPFFVAFKSGGYFGVGLYNFYDHLFSSFQPVNLVIAPGAYHYNNLLLSYGSDPSRKYVVAASINTGNYFNGWLNNYQAALKLVPIPNVSLLGTLSVNDFWHVGSTPHSDVSLLSLNTSLALNTKIILSGLVQANSADHSIGYNIRFAWEYSPLSYLYLVFNKIKPDNSLSQVTPLNQEIVKISYLYHF